MYLLLSLFITLPTLSYQTSETKLIAHFTEVISKFARPVTDNNQAVNVTFGFELIHLVAVSESEQSLKAKVWLRMNWMNELMKWDPAKWGNSKRIRLNYESVWTPDIFLEQDVGEELSSGPEIYKTPITCKFDGTHQWLIPVMLQSSCIFDVTNFPYDRQRCYLKFVSWTYDQKDMDVTSDPRPIVTENYINSAEWAMVTTSVQKNVKKYNCCPNPFVDITYTLTIDRRAMYYIFNAVVPCLIQMIIILFTFFLPPDSGERIGVVITVLLVFAVYLEVISGSLPKTSNSVPALSLFYIAAMVASSCSLIATCFVLVVHFKGTEKGVQPMPKWISRIFLERIGRYVGISKNLREHENDELLALDQNQKQAEDFEKRNSKFDNNAYANNPNNLFSGQNSMNAIVDEVRVITKLIEDQNVQDEVEEEWQTLGKVFDRLFFFLFLFIFVTITMAILLPVYIHYRTNH